MFNRLNLAGKIILTATVTSLGLLFIGFYIIIGNESREMFGMMKKHANIITQTVQGSVSYNYFNIEASSRHLQEYAESMAEISSVIHIEIFSPNLKVVAHTNRENVGGMPEGEHLTYVKKVFIDGILIEEVLPERGRYNVFFPVKIPLGKTGKNEIVGVIELSMKLLPDMDTQKTYSMKIIGSVQKRLSEYYESITRGESHLQSLAERLANIEGVIHVELFNKDERVIAHTIPSRVGQYAREAHHKFIKNVFSSGETLISMDKEKGEFLQFMPIVIDLHGTNEIVGVIELVMDLTAVNKKIGTMRTTMFTSAAFMALLIMIVLTLLLGRIVIKPVQELRIAAESVSKGNMDTQLVPRSPDEIGNLARSFNRMTDNLKIALEKLEKSKTEAEDANMIKTMFIANANHEFGTPLQSIIGLVSLIRDDLYESEEERKKFASDALAAGSLLTLMIGNLMNLSLIETGRRKTDLDRVPIGPIIEKIQTIMWVQAKMKGLTLESIFENSCQNELVWVDTGQLREVLMNLIGNAVKYTDTGSIKVICSLQKENGEMRVKVIDTGIGIKPTNQKFLFEPFVQADEAKERNGSGLGLAVAKSLCENTGISISLYSEGLGHGTTLTLQIPIEEMKES